MLPQLDIFKATVLPQLDIFKVAELENFLQPGL
jgi:hypothetical protein